MLEAFNQNHHHHHHQHIPIIALLTILNVFVVHLYLYLGHFSNCICPKFQKKIKFFLKIFSLQISFIILYITTN